MSAKNKVMVIGYLQQDPKVKNVAGRKMTRFGLTTSSTLRKGLRSRVLDEQLHTVVAWDALAVSIAAIARRGSQMAVEGKLCQRVLAVNDKKILVTEIVACKAGTVGPSLNIQALAA
jgi:single-strand DNA-binding protein